MRETVAVLNCDTKPYTEEWKGDFIEIPARKAISMNRRDAVSFLGTMSGHNPLDPQGLPLPKKLKIVPIDEAKPYVVKEYKDILLPPKQEFICNYDGKRFSSQDSLDAYLGTLTDKTMHPNDVIKDPEKQDPSAMVTCPFCNKNDLKGAIGLQNHIKHCPTVKSQNKPDQTEVTNDDTSDNIFTD